MEKRGYVYILASRRNGTLYIGVTSDILQRIDQHRRSLTPGFASEHGVTILVWYEPFADIEAAIRREKAMKAWKRDWKLRLIEAGNPEWLDLWPTLLGGEAGPVSSR